MRQLVPLVAALLMIAATPGQVPEPAGYWQGAMHGYTPSTLKGATVIETAALATLIDERHPVLVDVAEPDKKPAAMPASTLWLPAHRSLPGAVWLPGAGSPSDDPAFVAALTTRLAALTAGDHAKPVVTFCHPECWASWNAAKRLVALGYTRVYWYPDGMEGWQAAHETTIVKTDATWVPPVRKDTQDTKNNESRFR